MGGRGVLVEVEGGVDVDVVVGVFVTVGVAVNGRDPSKSRAVAVGTDDCKSSMSLFSIAAISSTLNA